MTKQEIKDNAPCGATHYEIESESMVYYYKLEGESFYIWNIRKGWIKKQIEWLSDAKPL